MTRWLFASVLCLSASGPAWAGRVETTHQSVPMDDAALVVVRLEFGAGQFELGKAAAGLLMEGTFDTDNEDMLALAHYRRRGQRGLLDLTSECRGHGFTGRFSNDWNVGLAAGVPLELEFELGAVEAHLDLSGLSVTQMEIEVGAADCEIRWDEPNPERLEDLVVTSGASSLRMEGLGHSGFERLRFEGGLGDFELDFSGDWAHSAEATFEVGLGELVLWLPEQIGVRLETESGWSSVKVDRHFEGRDGVYESPNYRTSEIQLDCFVEVGMGSLVVKTLGRTP